ncbi:MAG: Fic family protein [Microgenomates group bacterium Gr01-1014_16]|nr:MAG: Fic family protein [Microgenomates group bacterium Gr01-1014_16]
MDLTGYKWTISPQTQKQLDDIDILRKVFEKLPLPPEVIKIIRRKSIINSAVSSAQIENIPSTILSPRKEGKNLESAYTWIYSSPGLPALSVKIIKDFHRKTLQGISGSAGQYRSEHWGIFNQAGIEIHHPPLHTLLPGLTSEYVDLVNNLKTHPAISAAVGQFIFEKIHPFADGNGRTGRLISTYLLHKSGYGFGGLVPLERYIIEHRDRYYRALEPSHNCTEFIGYFLEGLISQANAVLEEIKNPPVQTSENKLHPRRRELLETIRDHPECSFDFLRRRFINTSQVSLHRDLQYLQKHNLIQKLGDTRGVLYTVVS